MITVLEAGQFTTIQDQGRFGYQAWGMPVSGAMDTYASAMANALAGNEKSKAVIEMTGRGGAFKFDQKTRVAVCGADMEGLAGSQKIKGWCSFFVQAGEVLRFFEAREGYRTYLAVQGGIDVPLVMGSRSTYTRAQLGGFEGRCLLPGDVLYIGKAVPGKEALAAEKSAIPRYEETLSLRVLGAAGVSALGAVADGFFAATYALGQDSDRVNYSLTGPLLPLTGRTDIISTAVGQGAIQITSAGLPYIVASDHGTIRGFSRIGYVIQADLPKLAQAKPGAELSFQKICEEEAVAIWRAERNKLDALK